MTRAGARVALLALALTSACRERAPEPRSELPEHLRPMKITSDSELMFVYADVSAAFKQTTRARSVPKASRRAVRVIDPMAKPVAAGDDATVHLVDLSDPNADGSFTTRLTTRLDFERRALAALPPGMASRVPVPRIEGDVTPAAAAPEAIVIYGTSWCGACKQLRAMLRELGVPFVDKDIERDPVAAAELARKAAQAGIRPDRVPIIDVRGRLLIGFDEDRIRTLLGERA